MGNYEPGKTDPPAANFPKYPYAGDLQTHIVEFKFDFEPPKHCSLTSGASCGTILDRGPMVTKSVSW